MIRTAGGAAMACQAQPASDDPLADIRALMVGGDVMLDRLLPALCRSLADWGPRHAIILNVAPVAVCSEDAVKLAAIIKETVLNAITHGRPLDGSHATVRVAVSRVGVEAVRVEVSDNGPGLGPRECRAARPRSGMALVRTLSARLGGQCRFEAEGGTRFILTFPLRPTNAQRRAAE